MGTYEDNHVSSEGVNANPSVLVVSDVEVAATSEEEANLLISVEMPSARGHKREERQRGRPKKVHLELERYRTLQRSS